MKSSAYYSATRTDMLRFIDHTPIRILDIGCGAGNFSLNFPKSEYIGVEPSIQAAHQSIARERNIIQGRYEDVANQIPDEYFDLIVCNDVIEHMADPMAFLLDVKTKLKAGGKLIASLPNVRNIEVLYNLIVNKDFQYADAGILDYTHLHFFTPKSFSAMATKCGWNVEIYEPISFTKDISPIKLLVIRILELFLGNLCTYQFGIRASIACEQPQNQ